MSALVCDLGGTTTRLGLVSDGALRLASVRVLPNDDFGDLDGLLADYLGVQGRPRLSEVVLAVAAPVDGRRLALTNRAWTIDLDALAARLGAPVDAINDFEALGHALAEPDTLAAEPLLHADTPAVGPRIVLGAGTGFNGAARLVDGTVVRCEIGHTTFPAETPLEHDLAARFVQAHGRCSLDRVLSGSGFLALYRTVCERADRPVRHGTSHALAAAGLSGDDPDAAEAAMAMARILGRTAGDLALTFLGLGGVYLTGGVTRALAPLLGRADGPFAAAFRAKGRMTDLMARVPVHLVHDDACALLGCRNWLLRDGAGLPEGVRRAG